MKFLSSVLLALTAAAGVMAQADNATQFAEGLLGALRQNNLNALADAVEANAQALLPALTTGGNKTVFAPSNEALMSLGQVDNETLIATLAYHVVNGSVTNDNVETGMKSIYATALNQSEFVDLPSNRSQVVVLSKQDGNDTVYIQQAGRNVSFAGTEDGPQFQNIRVQPINQVLMVPGNTSTIAGALGASQLAQLLQQANLVEALDSSMGVTVFAPTNEAIQSVQETIAAATPEQQAAVLLNHVVNGTVVYSTQLADTPSATSGSGQELRFMANDTGAFVMSGNVTARIVQSDYAASNGVIHVIDNVLVNTEQNTQAAESAFSSATAAAATQTAQPGVGGEMGSGSGSGSGSESGSGENAATSVKVGGGAAALAVLASGMWLLA